MRQVAITVFFVVLLASIVFVVIGGLDARPAAMTELPVNGSEPQANNTTQTTNVSAVNSSGARLAGAVVVEGIEIRNEQQNRTLVSELNQTKNNSTGSIVDATADSLNDQLAELETRGERLNAAYRSGTISEDRYRVESEAIAVEAEGIEDRVDLLQDVVESSAEPVAGDERRLERFEERADALADGDPVDDRDDDARGEGDDDRTERDDDDRNEGSDDGDDRQGDDSVNDDDRRDDDDDDESETRDNDGRGEEDDDRDASDSGSR